MVSDCPARRRPADFTVVLNAYSPLWIAAIAPLSQSVVSGTNACLNVREAPKASSTTFGRSPDGTAVTIAEVPAAAGGPAWYRVEQIGRWHDAELPDHSSLTKIRKRHGMAVFRRFFEMIVEQCQAAGLIWGKELYFDATQVKANASLASTAPR